MFESVLSAGLCEKGAGRRDAARACHEVYGATKRAAWHGHLRIVTSTARAPTPSYSSTPPATMTINPTYLAQRTRSCQSPAVRTIGTSGALTSLQR